MKKAIAELMAVVVISTAMIGVAYPHSPRAELVAESTEAVATQRKAQPMVLIDWPDETEEVEEEVEQEKPYTEQDVLALGQMVVGEALITQSDKEMSATVWVAINRFMSGDPYFRNCHSLYDIVVQENQFQGYSPNNEVPEHVDWLVRDVLERWSRELNGDTNVGRTLPADYLCFFGDGRHNHFTKVYKGKEKWDWSYENPYDS